MIRVAAADPRSADGVAMLDALSDTLAEITGSSGRASFDPADVEREGAYFALAYDSGGRAVGCGAYRPLEPGVAEVKRMFAAPGTHGVGAAVLRHLEETAGADGYRELWCETRLVNRRAVRFYEGHGFRPIENFGKYRGRAEAVCFAKPLSP